jgi:signal transduction histidine kinase
MNLQVHLLLRITLVAVFCLLINASYMLYQNHRVAEQSNLQIVETLQKQLEAQLLLRKAGIGQATIFPDFEWWKRSNHQPGMCIDYTSSDHALTHSLCSGSTPITLDWPAVFAVVYRQLFNPGQQAVRSIALPDHVYGTLTVTPNAELEIASAWTRSLSLMTLSSVTILGVSLLVYLSISKALQPATTIVLGLKKMDINQLAYRLPEFKLSEWQRIATAINQLASNQQQLLEERQTLLVKIMTVQEEERRYLAQELHDELGQCLAAINAVATSIQQTATQQCPTLIEDAEHISRITTHTLHWVRGMLGRLRPPEFDELGLAISLNSLIAGWNERSNGKTNYRFNMLGDSSLLSLQQSIALFRVVQECLTNIAKHAQATQVSITLSIDAKTAALSVQDNGIATQLSFPSSSGIGLLGMRERVAALHGKLTLTIANPQGLIVAIHIPMHSEAEQLL